MYKYLAIILLFFSSTLFAQDTDPFETLRRILIQSDKVTQEEKREIQLLDKIEDKLRTPQSEVEDAIFHLTTRVDREDWPFIRFFSTYSVPKNQREDAILTLSFCIHSLVGLSDDPDEGNAGGYYPLAIREDGEFKTYRRVRGSDTLWWIDLRDYNWTPQAWETISTGDGYFSEPVVSHDRSGALRLIAGNAVLRADWFIAHVMSSTEQLDIDGPDNFYETLLYALRDKPEKIDEWRKAWTLDIKRARSIGNEYGTLTDSTAVARHNRMLFGYRTELGYMYETYDVKNQLGKRDYLETVLLNDRIGGPPEISDAGEAFASNSLGLQVYALRDGAGNIVDFADPTVARHMNDVLGDARVITARSCIDCHASGPLPAENLIDEITRNSRLRLYDKRDAVRLKRNLLSKKFRESVEENQKLFARSVKRVNGLTPLQNGQLFLKNVDAYRRPVDLKTAAFECGVTVEDFVAAIRKTNPRFGNRLKLLVENGQVIPRDVWESPGRDGIPGAFQQAMIILYALDYKDSFIQIKEKKENYSKSNFTKDSVEQIRIIDEVLRLQGRPRFLPIDSSKSRNKYDQGKALFQYNVITRAEVFEKTADGQYIKPTGDFINVNDTVYASSDTYPDHKNKRRFKYIYGTGGIQGFVEVPY